MLKNRAIQIRLAPRNKTDEETDGNAIDKFERIIEISQDAVVTTAVAIGGIYAASRVVKTVCKVVETAAKSHL